ncbi:MAG: hypothetical protein HW407_676 [Bacteroidetes bacterium]|nr:hypothetical protein [Bacteroidota bacterium]
MAPPGKKSGQQRSGSGWSTEFGPFLTLGLQLALAVGAFAALGWWLDTKWGTTPWLLLTGVILGAVGGGISFIKAAMALGKKQDSKRHRQSERED